MREIVLPRVFDITAVTAVASELVSALAAGEITVDASVVTKIDAAGLQLLCAAAVSARASQTPVVWRGVPSVVEQGAHTLALGDTLGWPRTSPQENR